MASYDDARRSGRNEHEHDDARDHQQRYSGASHAYDQRGDREGGRGDRMSQQDRGYRSAGGRSEDDFGRYGGSRHDFDEDRFEGDQGARRRNWFGGAGSRSGSAGNDDRYGSQGSYGVSGLGDGDRNGEGMAGSWQRRSGYGSGQYGGSQRGQGLGMQDYGGMQGGSDMQRGGMRGQGPKGYTRSDDRIREDVCDCLTDDPHLDASGLEVQVKSGEVTLSGIVKSRDAKRHAEELAERASGVKHVQNNLRIREASEGDSKPSAAAATAAGRAS